MPFPTVSLLLRCCVASTLALSISVASTAAEPSDWPQWRGPTGNGVSADAKPPVKWSESKNVAWKVAIPGTGSASPIVWRDKVFVATAVPTESAAAPDSSDGDGEPRRRRGDRAGRSRRDGDEFRAQSQDDDRRRDERRGRGRRGGRRGRGGGDSLKEHRFVLLALDRATGKTLWEATATTATPHQGHHRDHGFASASPFTDGERVYTHFGSRGLFCYTLDGTEVWKRDDFGKMDTRNGFGEGSSPSLHGDTIILPWDHEGPSYIAAIDKTTGKTRWKIERDEHTSWATPLVVEHDGEWQVIASGQEYARGYSLKDGKELWRCSGQTARPVASPVAGHGMAFIGSGFRGAFLGAFDLSKRGDLEESDGVAWSISRSTPDIPSLLLSGSRLYFHSRNSGIISCHDAKTGKPHYSQERVPGLGGDVYASPVAANGHVYLTSRDGATVVIEDSDTFKVVATNQLDDPIDATPAIAGRELFLRGQKHLYCIRG